MRDYFSEGADDTTSRLDVLLHQFQSPPALVAALLADGSLGPFQLLPPHQAEFLRSLDGFEEHYSYDPSREAAIRELFLDAVGLRRPRGPRHPAIDQLSTDRLERYVASHMGRADESFRALQGVSHTWWERLGVAD